MKEGKNLRHVHIIWPISTLYLKRFVKFVNVYLAHAKILTNLAATLVTCIVAINHKLGGWRKSADKPHSVPLRVMIIYLGRLLLDASCNLPKCQTARAAPSLCLVLLPVGFA